MEKLPSGDIPEQKPAQMPLENIDYELFIFFFTILSLLIALTLIFIPLAPATDQILREFNLVITFIFLADFVYLLIRAKNKIAYMKSQGWLDLLGSLPVYPVFRFFRVYRLARVWRELRKQGAHPIWNVIRRRRAQNALRYAALVVFMVIGLGSILVLQFESQAQGGNIQTPQEAIWWSMVTIATVGYGDYYPVTLDGRLVGMMLMIVGVGMFGVLSSFLATNFLKPTREEQESQERAEKENRAAAIRQEVEPLKNEIAALRLEIAALHDTFSAQKRY